MGYRKLATTDIEDLLRRWLAQQGVRQIARETGIDRKTIRRYIAAAKGCAIGGDGELSREDVTRVIKRVQARPARSPSEAWSKLLPYKDRIADCVDDDQRLRLRAARAMLAAEGIHVTYWTLRRFALRARLEKSLAQPPAKPDGASSSGNGQSIEKAPGQPPVKPGDGATAGNGQSIESTLDHAATRHDGDSTADDGRTMQPPLYSHGHDAAHAPSLAPDPSDDSRGSGAGRQRNFAPSTSD